MNEMGATRRLSGASDNLYSTSDPQAKRSSEAGSDTDSTTKIEKGCRLWRLATIVWRVVSAPFRCIADLFCGLCRSERNEEKGRVSGANIQFVHDEERRSEEESRISGANIRSVHDEESESEEESCISGTNLPSVHDEERRGEEGAVPQLDIDHKEINDKVFRRPYSASWAPSSVKPNRQSSLFDASFEHRLVDRRAPVRFEPLEASKPAEEVVEDNEALVEEEFHERVDVGPHEGGNLSEREEAASPGSIHRVNASKDVPAAEGESASNSPSLTPRDPSSLKRRKLVLPITLTKQEPEPVAPPSERLSTLIGTEETVDSEEDEVAPPPSTPEKDFLDEIADSAPMKALKSFFFS